MHASQVLYQSGYNLSSKYKHIKHDFYNYLLYMCVYTHVGRHMHVETENSLQAQLKYGVTILKISNPGSGVMVHG